MRTNVINGNVIIYNEIEMEFIYRSFDFRLRSVFSALYFDGNIKCSTANFELTNINNSVLFGSVIYM